jgi:2-polyprenyl-3-methyl-5-hydroxy-6-metoxy-1,4-benzoquinol methylase
MMQRIFKYVLIKVLRIFSPYFAKNLYKDVNIKKTVELYKKDEFTRFFSQIRFWDAPFEKLIKLIPERAKVLDLGCGDGIFSNFIALSHKGTVVTGIDINKQRIKEAYRGLSNTSFSYGNVLTAKFPKSDIILMTHLLHHLPSKKDQEILILKSIKSLNKGGKLIISEVAEKPFWKYLVSWITDASIVPILFEKQVFTTKFFYRSTQEWLSVLKKNKLNVKSISAHKGKPFSHVILIATIK